MLRECKFDTGEVVLNYVESAPAGPALVLLHGIPGRWQEFLPIIPALGTRWRVCAIDLRGHGASGRVPGQYLPENYIRDTVAFLERGLTEPAVVFGMSASGLGALCAAARCPDRFRGLVAGDSPIDLDALVAWMESPGFVSHFAAERDLAGSRLTVAELAEALGDLPAGAAEDGSIPRYRDLPGRDELQLRGWAQTLSDLDPDVLAHHGTGRGRVYLTGIDMDAAMRSVECPVLLVQADPERGSLMSADAATRATGILADGLQVVLTGHGHSLGLDTWQTAPLLAALTGFLEQL